MSIPHNTSSTCSPVYLTRPWGSLTRLTLFLIELGAIEARLAAVTNPITCRWTVPSMIKSRGCSISPDEIEDSVSSSSSLELHILSIALTSVYSPHPTMSSNKKANSSDAENELKPMQSVEQGEIVQLGVEEGSVKPVNSAREETGLKRDLAQRHLVSLDP